MSRDSLGTSRDVKEMGALRRTIMLVDGSLRPKSNDRSAKLGLGNQTFASMIIAYDMRAKLVNSGDGTGSKLVRYPFEPDNFIFRKHGDGFDSVWAARLVVDKENKANEKKNRSTHFINQGKDQGFGTAADLFWICKRGTSTEYGIDGAGFYSGGGSSRDLLALSIARNEGHVSDGKAFGPLAHVLCFIDPDNSVPTPGKPPGTTTPTGGNRPIPTVGNTNGFSAPGPGVATGEGNVTAPNTSTGEVPIPGTPGGQEPGNVIPDNDPIRTGRF